jgi:hypothetical protein
MISPREAEILGKTPGRIFPVRNVSEAHVTPWVANLTEENSLCVQWDLRYGDFGSHGMLEAACGMFVMLA